MLSLVEQAFVGREEIRAPLKTPAWEATSYIDTAIGFPANNNLLKGDLQLYLWCYPVLQLLKPANPPCLFDFFFVLFFSSSGRNNAKYALQCAFKNKTGHA